MKLTAMMFDGDVQYLQRLADYFALQYNGKIDLVVFSVYEKALAYIENEHPDIVLVNANEKFSPEHITWNAVFAYLSEDSTIRSIKEHTAVSKYQKIEDIYKWMVASYAQRAGDAVEYKNQSSKGTTILSFVGYGAASGTSSVALACAKAYQHKGYQVTYMNMEQFPGLRSFFEGSNGGVSDLIYAVRSKKGNVDMKVQGLLNKEEDGMFYVRPATCVLDLMEICDDDMQKMTAAVIKATNCDFLIIDTDYMMIPLFDNILEVSNRIVLVCDGSRLGNDKLMQYMTMIKVKEERVNYMIQDKMRLIFNKFSNKSSQALELGISELGGNPTIKNADELGVIEQLSVNNETFDKLLQDCGKSL